MKIARSDAGDERERERDPERGEPARSPAEPAGPAGPARARPSYDEVDEAGHQSFPASDPPGWGPLHPGAPGEHG